MKILESQSAILTNYEVFQHLQEQRRRYAQKGLKGRRPGNLETVVKELLEYFNEAPSPLASKPFPYHQNTIRVLLERLRPYKLAKAEVLMIMNLRPANGSGLNTILEEMGDRFSEDQQEEILVIIGEVLGTPDGAAERKVMADNAKEARMEQFKEEVQQGEDMEVDG